MLSALAALAICLGQDAPQPGANIQRTMAMLASSSPTNHPKVRILFYGQSITQQDWSRIVTKDLRKRFPDADLVVENRAIGGFAANVLARTAAADVDTFWPDLIIFHDYGGEPDYEKLVRGIRSRTTAEMLLQSDHVDAIPTDNASKDVTQRYEWHNQHAIWLADLAKKLNLGFVDVRAKWSAELAARKIEPKALLRDNVHLNHDGDLLMAQLISDALVVAPGQVAGISRDAIRETTAKSSGRSVTLDFVGSRIDLTGPRPVGATVLIDGRKPSETASLYSFSRSSGAFEFGVIPALVHVESDVLPVEEEWTAKLSGFDDACRKFKFSVSGSVTGPDGEGDSSTRFVSRSGRVVIDPHDWNLATARQVTKHMPPDGFEVKWRVTLLGADLIPAGDGALTLAQGLPNGPHKIELLMPSPGKVKVRVYRPPLMP